MLKRSYQKKCLLATTVMLLVAVGMVAMPPAHPTSGATIITAHATIYVVSDWSYPQWRAIDVVEDAVNYLQSAVAVTDDWHRIDYKIVDKGSSWSNFGVFRGDPGAMVDDLKNDKRSLLTKQGHFLIGFTDTMLTNGISQYWAYQGVSVVAGLPFTGVNNIADEKVTLHELSHAMGQLSKGEFGHVDKWAWTDSRCVMNYAKWSYTSYLCGECKGEIAYYADYWYRTTSDTGGGPY